MKVLLIEHGRIEGLIQREKSYNLRIRMQSKRSEI